MAFDKLTKVNDEIEEYQNISSNSQPSSDHYNRQIQKRDKIAIIKTEIATLASQVFLNIENASDFQMLAEIRINMQKHY